MKYIYISKSECNHYVLQLYANKNKIKRITLGQVDLCSLSLLGFWDVTCWVSDLGMI